MGARVVPRPPLLPACLAQPRPRSRMQPARSSHYHPVPFSFSLPSYSRYCLPRLPSRVGASNRLCHGRFCAWEDSAADVPPAGHTSDSDLSDTEAPKIERTGEHSGNGAMPGTFPADIVKLVARSDPLPPRAVSKLNAVSAALVHIIPGTREHWPEAFGRKPASGSEAENPSHHAAVSNTGHRFRERSRRRNTISRI